MSQPTQPPSLKKCSICLSPSPKYTCPGCLTPNCSLACVRMHKQRTLCTGQRNATAYLSAKQLSTAKAFDSDFNLIAGIERGVERSARVLAHASAGGTASGGETTTGSAERNGLAGTGERKVRTRIEDAGVKLWSAPRGMRRKRDNGTYWDSKRKHLVWTLEWKFLAQTTLGQAAETLSLAQAHDLAVIQTYQNAGRAETKSKLKSYAQCARVRVPESWKGRQGLIAELELESLHGTSTETPSSQPQLAAAEAVTHLPPKTTRMFYIHRPEVSSAKAQILTRVSGSTSIRDILCGRTVREFPMFVVGMEEGVDEVDWTVWKEVKDREEVCIDDRINDMTGKQDKGTIRVKKQT